MRTSTWAVVVVGIGLWETRVEAQQAGRERAIKDGTVLDDGPPDRGSKALRPPAMIIRGRVVDSPAQSPWPRPEDAIRLALRQKQRMFEHCFDMELRKQAPFNGSLLLELSVTADGLVTRAQVTEGNKRETAVGACIAAHIRTIKLPTLAYDADLILPIRLEAQPLRPPNAI